MARYHYYDWIDTSNIDSHSFICGYCGNSAGPGRAYHTGNHSGIIYICPTCSQPTFVGVNQTQTPKPRLGTDIGGISDPGVAQLYKEARDCTSVGAYTAAVMACRKILMNLAVDKSAKEGESYESYVKFLSDNGYIPPQGKQWVDRIRKQGNEANHKIALKELKDAKLMLDFTASLLRFNYELVSLLEDDAKSDTNKESANSS